MAKDKFNNAVSYFGFKEFFTLKDCNDIKKLVNKADAEDDLLSKFNSYYSDIEEYYQEIGRAGAKRGLHGP